MTGEKPAHAMADQCSSMLVSAFQSLGRRWKVSQPGTSDCLFYVLRALTESTEIDPLMVQLRRRVSAGDQRPDGRVTAPVDADDTSATYFAMTPVR